MEHCLTIIRTCSAAALVAAIGLSVNGCKDTVSVSPDVAVPLASLTVTPGTLQPAFFSNTIDYAVDAPTSAASVTVAAIPRDSTVIVTINGAITTQRTIPLGAPGSITTITIDLASQTGGETTYTVNVTRLLSSDNNLSTLTVTSGTLEPSPFNANTLNYTVAVANTVPQVSVVATKSDKDATMVITSEASSITAGPGVNPGQLLVTLGGPGTAAHVSIEVTAPNNSKKTYQVTVNRLSGDNNLKSLTVSPGVFNHPFDPAITNYTVDVAHPVGQVTVSATKSDLNAAMSGSLNAGPGTPIDTETLGLGGQGTSTDFFITVAAPDPTVSSKTYKITVNRAAPSSNNNLATLNVTPGALTPGFAPGIQDYTVDVATDDNSVTVTATLQDPNATMLINGQGTSSGQPREISPLQSPGSDTIITIVVVAQNGAQKSYTITVRRPLPSSDANLSALSVNEGSLNPPFADPTILDYSIDGALNVPTVTVTATKSDPNATMSALGTVIAAPGTQVGQVPIQTGTNATVGIKVIAQDGVTNQIYNITIP